MEENKIARGEEIEKVIEENIRPYLNEHHGDIEVVSLENKVLKVKLLGNCEGCPSAQLTMESLIEKELTDAFPDLIERVSMIDEISDELYNLAKEILAHKRVL